MKKQNPRNNKKIPGSGGGRIPGRQSIGGLMSLQYFITKLCGSKQYFRKLIVRAIEDGIILFLGGVAIWAVCWFLTGILKALGVA